jgi:putative SOS response-associated peptidase YedK
MCGRATLTNQDFEEVAAELDAAFAPDDARLYRRRYNIAPTDLHWTVASSGGRRVLVPTVWGYLAAGRPLINVRGEQVGSGRGFREAFRSHRCLVVTDGFYEWDRQKVPSWYHRPGGGLVLLAGLFQDPAGARPRFTILTTRPNRVVAEVHERMPVIIAPAAIDEWLTADPARAAALIAPAPDDTLVATRVSKRVNSVKNDDPACVRPEDPTGLDAPAQGSLF